MNLHADQTHNKKSQSETNRASQEQQNSPLTFQFVDKRPEAIAQRKFQDLANNSPRAIQTKAIQEMAKSSNQNNAPIQRLVADGLSKLYAPPAWFGTALADPRTETLSEVYFNERHANLKRELLTNLNESAGFYISDIETASNGKDIFESLEGQITLPRKAKKKRQLKAWAKTALTTAVNDLNSVTYPMTDGREVTEFQFRTKKITQPKDLVMGPSDLDANSPDGGGFSIVKVCALIAIYKSNNGAGSGSEEAYKELHASVYDDEGIEYDESASHPALFGREGFTMIHSGRTAWGDLHKVLSKALKPGKKYIFDLSNHSVFVTMKKAFTPGLGRGEETFAAFFDFHSDPTNFNTGELNAPIDYIYEK